MRFGGFCNSQNILRPPDMTKTRCWGRSRFVQVIPQFGTLFPVRRRRILYKIGRLKILLWALRAVRRATPRKGLICCVFWNCGPLIMSKSGLGHQRRLRRRHPPNKVIFWGRFKSYFMVVDHTKLLNTICDNFLSSTNPVLTPLKIRCF